MNEPQPVAVENFSHVCIGVSDMEKSLAFYTAVLGMDVVFDVELAGAGLDAVTGGAAQNGRMVGGLIGGAMVELLFLGDVPVGPAGPRIGYTNMSFRVADLDDTFETLRRQHPDVRTDAAVDIVVSRARGLSRRRDGRHISVFDCYLPAQTGALARGHYPQVAH